MKKYTKIQRSQLTKAILKLTANYNTRSENEVDFSTARPKKATHGQ